MTGPLAPNHRALAAPESLSARRGDGRHEVGPAVFSDDRIYRYTLTRTWDEYAPGLMVIGLNPSTADEHALDPTLRKVRGFAQRNGYGGFTMTNLFGIRATDPKVMMAAEHPVGPDNDRWLKKTAIAHVSILCAWGTKGGHRDRDRAVMEILAGIERRFGHDCSIMCLERTKDGYPKHPLYVANEVGDKALRERQRYVGR
jgi:hypothetical protein